MIGVLLVATLFLNSLILISFYRYERLVAGLLGLAVLSAGQIVFLCQILTLIGWLQPSGLLLGQIVVLVAASYFWFGNGKPDVWRFLRDFDGIWRDMETPFIPLTFLALLVSLLAVLVSRGSIVAPDAMTYHLPRVHYWLNQGSAFHFPTDDYRQVEFPPNASFLFLWVIAATGKYDAAFVAQFAAGIAGAFGISGLTRLGGSTRLSAFLASFAFLTAPMVMLQLVTAQIDLVTNLFVISLVFYSSRYLVNRGEAYEGVSGDLLLAGVSFGLAIGSKLTPIFLLPALAIYLLVLSYISDQRSPVRRLILVAISWSLGFIVFGAFNYALNTLEFGNPIASEEALNREYEARFSSFDSEEVRSLRSPTANLMRYAYQTMDWILLPNSGFTNFLFRTNLAAYRNTASSFGLDLEAAPGFDYEDFGWRPISQNRAGFGVLGYMVLLLSPVLFLACIWEIGRNAEVSSVMRFGYLFLVLSWFVAFSFSIPWSEVRIRYFVIPISFLLAAVIPTLVDHRKIRLPLTLMMLISLAVQTLPVAKWANSLQQERTLINERHFRVLKENFPPEAYFGVRGRVWFPLILERFPGYRFRFVEAEPTVEALQSLKLDGIILSEPDGQAPSDSIPFGPGQELIVRGISEPLRNSAEAFALDLEDWDGCGRMILSDGYLLTRLAEEERRWEFVLPSSPIRRCPDGVLVRVGTDHDLEQDAIENVQCTNLRLNAVEFRGGQMELSGSITASDSNQTFSCAVTWREGKVGLTNRQALNIEVIPDG